MYISRPGVKTIFEIPMAVSRIIPFAPEQFVSDRLKAPKTIKPLSGQQPKDRATRDRVGRNALQKRVNELALNWSKMRSVSNINEDVLCQILAKFKLITSIYINHSQHSKNELRDNDGGYFLITISTIDFISGLVNVVMMASSFGSSALLSSITVTQLPRSWPR